MDDIYCRPLHFKLLFLLELAAIGRYTYVRARARASHSKVESPQEGEISVFIAKIKIPQLLFI